MRIISKGRVTIPSGDPPPIGSVASYGGQARVAADHARIRKAGIALEKAPRVAWQWGRSAARGTWDVRMSTDEIMALTRGKVVPRKRHR